MNTCWRVPSLAVAALATFLFVFPVQATAAPSQQPRSPHPDDQAQQQQQQQQQEEQQTPKPGETKVPLSREAFGLLAGLPVNIKIDVTVTDQTGGAPPDRKTLTLTLADGQRGSIRTQGRYLAEVRGSSRFEMATLAIDAAPKIVQPVLRPDAPRVQVMLTLSYDVPAKAGESDSTGDRAANQNQSMTLVLDSGKPMIASQSADPLADRKVTVEVMATVLDDVDAVLKALRGSLPKR
jgi:hypothetical protein